jgi:hypothetical protein
MSDARSTYRLAALLLGASVLAVGSLVVSGYDRAHTEAAAATESAPDTVDPADRGQSPSFEKWAEDSDEADGKGRLIGEIERDGKMVELRQLPDAPGAEEPTQDSPADDTTPDQGESAP